MQPGPVTATAITLGTKNKFSGFELSVGHGIIEFPLMVLIILGMGDLLKSTLTQIIIGLAGGAVLLIMAVQMLRSTKLIDDQDSGDVKKSNPIIAGIALSAGNPYFLIWWATIGLALATDAVGFGIYAFVLFAIVHWSVDCIWLQILSYTSFKGSRFFGNKIQRYVILFCSAALILFAAIFVFHSLELTWQSFS